MDETGWNRSLELNSVRCLLRHRRWRLRDWVGFCLPITFFLILAWFHFSSPPPALSVANYERIKIGMTADEVDGIIRARPGTYDPFLYVSAFDLHEGTRFGGSEGFYWQTSFGNLVIRYDVRGFVCEKSLTYRASETSENPEVWPFWKRLLCRTWPTGSGRHHHSYPCF